MSYTCISQVDTTKLLFSNNSHTIGSQISPIMFHLTNQGNSINLNSASSYTLSFEVSTAPGGFTTYTLDCGSSIYQSGVGGNNPAYSIVINQSALSQLSFTVNTTKGFYYRNPVLCYQTLTTVSENTRKQESFFYPNPVSDVLYVKDLRSCEIKIYDQTGKAIIRRQFNQEGIQIDVSNLSNGIYVIEKTDKAGSVRQRMVKE